MQAAAHMGIHLVEDLGAPVGLIEQLQWEAAGANGPADVVLDEPALRALLDRDRWADRDAKPQKRPKRPKLWSPRFPPREGTSREPCRSAGGSMPADSVRRLARAANACDPRANHRRMRTPPRVAHWEPSSGALTHWWVGDTCRDSCAGPSALPHRTRMERAL
jgi:hypothetical protein